VYLLCKWKLNSGSVKSETWNWNCVLSTVASQLLNWIFFLSGFIKDKQIRLTVCLPTNISGVSYGNIVNFLILCRILDITMRKKNKHVLQDGSEIVQVYKSLEYKSKLKYKTLIWFEASNKCFNKGNLGLTDIFYKFIFFRKNRTI